MSEQTKRRPFQVCHRSPSLPIAAWQILGGREGRKEMLRCHPLASPAVATWHPCCKNAHITDISGRITELCKALVVCMWRMPSIATVEKLFKGSDGTPVGLLTTLPRRVPNEREVLLRGLSSLGSDSSWLHEDGAHMTIDQFVGDPAYGSGLRRGYICT